MRKKDKEHGGQLYVITNKHYDGYIKIGRTVNITNRLHGYNSSTPFPVVTLHYLSNRFKNVHKMERELIRRLGVPDNKSEWYIMEIEKAIDVIITLEGLEEEGMFDE